MRFQIKKILEGYDPADLIEQSMYCFGSDDGGGGGGGDSSSMGMDDDVSAQASVTDTSSNNDNSSDQDNFNNTTNFSYPNATNYSVQQIDPYDIQQTQAQNFATNIGLATLGNANLSPQAMASIGTTGYSPSSVTGFANPTDVSDFTNASQMQSMSNINNLAKTGMIPNVPTPIGALLNNLSKVGYQNTIDQVNMGYTPTYSGGQVDGTTGYGIGMGSPDGAVQGYNVFSANSPSEKSFGGNDIGGNESEVIKPATRNPVSGQPVCPDGYRYDDDLQACRLDTTSPNRPNNPNPFPSGDAYYRATSLDQAPVNAPSGFDFNSANQNFIDGFAYRPANFTNQMGLNGFTPFRRS